MKSVHFLEKKFSMTKKKKVVRIFFRELKGTFKDFFLKIYFHKFFAPPNICDPNFCPPNIYDKSTPLVKTKGQNHTKSVQSQLRVQYSPKNKKPKADCHFETKFSQVTQKR